MVDPSALTSNAEGTTRRFLTFRMGESLYAVPAEAVSEVIRTPPVARVPQGPKSLLGVANLRGAVLPIASLRGLLGRGEIAPSATIRSIVLNGAAPVGLAVDAVDALVTVDEANIETRQAELATEPGERLSGAFQPNGRNDVAKILDLRSLLEAAFVQRPRPQRDARVRQDLASLAEASEAAEDRQKLVTFNVAGQEFALGLEAVREIVPAPERLAGAPRAEALVLGVMAYRDTLLPLLSLRGLLGFPPTEDDGAREKVVVTAVGGVLVGLVADRMRAIVAADPTLIEPTPAMLAARTGGEAQIKAIYRGDGGRRLISILDSEQLFRKDIMARLGSAEVAAAAPQDAGMGGEEALFLVFRLGDDEFGLPIAVVDEVAPAPDKVTRLPKTPAFLEGVVNLRGEVLPVIDQRRRFDMPASEGSGRRLIVVRTERYRAGLIVDSVSEVLRSRDDAIEPAPDLAGEATRLVHGVINLEAAGRLIMLLDPSELLSRTERGLLATYKDAGEPAGA
jgi:purine-binding chemotaxis protein CheW